MLRILFAVSLLALLAGGGIVVGSVATRAQEQSEPEPPQTPLPPHDCHRKPPVTS